MDYNTNTKSELQKNREEKRIEKEKEKAAKQAQAAVAKGMKKENWMDYMTILIDNGIAQQKGGTEIITTLELEGMKCEVVNQPLSNTVSFDRLELSADEGNILKNKVHEDTVLIVEQAEAIADHIEKGGLVAHARRSCAILSEEVLCSVTFFIFGLDRLMKSKRKGAMDRLQWEEGLLELQLELNITSYCIKDNAELTDNIRMFCKSLGERPHKLKQHKDLFVGANKEVISVDKDGRGYLQVWIAQLQDIRSINEAIASSVARQYPSPVLFSNFLKSCDKDVAVKTLSDIPVRRGVGALANVRRVGVEAAKRLVQYFSVADPAEEIS